jgi:hypothetical protein
MVAQAALSWAQEKEQAAGKGATPEQKADSTKLYQQAADLTAPLVAKRFPGSDEVFMQVNHALGLDAKTQTQFESIVGQDPKDDSAVNTLMFVCSQYLFDFDCSFQAAQKDVALHDPTGPYAADDYLNLAESAVLAGKDDQAGIWLGIASKQSNTTPRENSLIYLYSLWLAVRKGQNNLIPTDFQSWQTATNEFRKTLLRVIQR